MDWKLEAVPLPVAVVDRAKAFYVEALGFSLDVDHQASESFRIVQVTPPGSGCSLVFGTGIIDPDRVPVQGLTLVVTDVEQVVAVLDAAGIEHGGIVHYVDGVPTPGPDPQRRRFNSIVHFADPDGNSFTVQENAEES